MAPASPPPTVGAISKPWRLEAACVALALVMGFAAVVPKWRALFVLAALLLGVVVLLAWRRDGLMTRRVLVVAVLMRLAVVWMPPTLSDDAWRYAWDGLVQTRGIGPYSFRPGDAALADVRATSAGGALFERMNSPAYYSVYPPLSQLVFTAAASVGRGPLATVYLIKLALAAAEIGGLLLLARMVSPRSLVLYAWHPLAVIESAGQAHGEALLVGLLLACVWLARASLRQATARRAAGPALAGIALGAAVMVKLYPLVLLPFLWQRLGRWSVVAAVAVMAALALPYASAANLAHVRESLGLYVGLFDFNALPYQLLRGIANAVEPSGRDMGKLVIGKALGVAFLLGVAVLTWRGRRWPLDRVFAATLGLYLACSTTVHPWYLLGLLALPATLGGGSQRPRWHWLWLGLMTMGTYLRYVPSQPLGGEGAYLCFVYAGWTGWLLLLTGGPLLQAVLRQRGRSKARRVAARLPPGATSVLDLGAGEGYVGEAIQRRAGVRVTLADVIPLRRVRLPAVRYDGRRLPFAAGAFDAVVLYFVLHHSDRPRRVLAEALRVCRARGGRVIVVESVYRRPWERALLDRLDRLANRLRGGSHMAGQEPHLHFRRAGQWAAIAASLGGRVVAREEHGRPPHRQATLVIEPPADTEPPAAG